MSTPQLEPIPGFTHLKTLSTAPLPSELCAPTRIQHQVSPPTPTTPALSKIATIRIRSLITIAVEIIYQARPADRMDRKHFDPAARFLILHQRRNSRFCGSVAVTSCHIRPSTYRGQENLFEVFGGFRKANAHRAYAAVVSYEAPHHIMMKSFRIVRSSKMHNAKALRQKVAPSVL